MQKQKTFAMNFLLRFSLVLTAFCLVSANLVGQESRSKIENTAVASVSDNHTMSWEQFVERMMGEEWNSDDEAVDDDELLQTLYELYLHPLNINEVAKEDLLVLPFIDEEKANEIMSYIDHNRPMRSFGELMLIGTLSKTDREMLRLFLLPPEECSGNEDRLRLRCLDCFTILQTNCCCVLTFLFIQKMVIVTIPKRFFLPIPTKCIEVTASTMLCAIHSPA